MKVMMDAFGDRQKEVLKQLLKHRDGLGADEIADRVGVTRPAVRQHLMALERQGYVKRGELHATGGRPSQTYVLTPKGYELFPKQYSWFSEVLLETLRSRMGEKEMGELMNRLGKEVAGQVGDRVQGETLGERVQQIAALMTDLAYQAEATFTGKERAGSPPVIEANNCVFHALATRFPEVCKFDLSLLSKLSGTDVIHEQCIVRGGGTCRFRFTTATKKA